MSDETSDKGDISLEKLTRIYIKMRDKKAEIAADLESKIEKIEDSMKMVKGAILDHMKSMNATSIKTASGTLIRTTRTTYTTNDWESMGKFILEHQAPELLEKRIHQGNMKQFLEEHPDVLPPGLNANSEYSVTVRRSKDV